jgi:hypothetical protein
MLLCAAAAVAQQAGKREERRPDEMADLSAFSLTVSPAYPLPGEVCQIRLRVRNRAEDPARVEVSFFVGGRALQSRTVVIAAQSDETISVPWTPKSPAAQVVSALVDPRQRLTELDRVDNAIAVDVVVADRPPPGADFVVSAVETLSAPERPSILRVVVKNEGGTRGSAPLVLRRDGKLVTTVLAGPIEPGASVTIEVPWSDAGADRVRAEVNPRFGRVEKHPENNLRDYDPRPAVDLRVMDLGFQTAHMESGQRRRVVVSFRIVNAGRQNVTQSFRTSIEPGLVDPDGVPRPFYVTTAGLRAGGTVFVSHMIESAPSDFVATVKVDVDHVVTESDESNNDAAAHFSNPAPDIDRWVSIGPRRITGAAAQGYGWNDSVGRLSAMAIDPTAPATMYVGAQTGGVWKTLDGGANWQPIGDSATVRIAALGLAPDNTSRLFIVTPHDGVFRSDDAGTSWLQISTQDLDAVVHGGVLLIHPTNTNEMLVASNGGVYRSTDDGVTWLQTLSGGASTGLVRLPANARLVFAAIFHKTDASVAGVYQSFDGGATWRAMQGCPGGTLPVADDNTTIRLAASGAQLFASYRKKDPLTFRLFRTHGIGCLVGGRSDSSFETGWSPTGSVDGEPIPAVLWSGLWADPTDAKNVYLGGTYFWTSTNNGSSFTRTSSLDGAGSAHSDHHNAITDPQDAKVMYSLNDGGIYRSASHGATGTWHFIGDGIFNVEFYDHVSAPTKADLVIGGTQDNGTMKAAVGQSAVWTMIRGGDGATVDIDPTNPQILYSMNQYASSIARSDSGGSSFSAAAGGLPAGTVCFNLHFQVHPRQPATLLASCEGLWQSVDSGTSWSVIFTPATGAVARTAVDGPAGIYYVGSTVGAIVEGPSGAGWRQVFTHPGAMGVTDIEIDADERTNLYASFGGGGSGRVFRLVKSATSPATYAAGDITFDMPAGRTVQTIGIDRNHRFTLFAGTDRGVFRGRSSDGGQTWFWLPYGNGLPSAADVRDLEVHPGTGVMRAATFGRSAFEVNTDHPMGSVLAVEGKLTFLRVHDPGTGFGPPVEFLDTEVVVKVDTAPLKAFGFQLREDGEEAARRGMLALLRDAFRQDRRVRIEYVRTSIHHGVIFRVVQLQ